MTGNEQITFLARREIQHLEYVKRAARLDTATFHEEMAGKFRRLIEEAGTSIEPVVDAIVGAPGYLDW